MSNIIDKIQLSGVTYDIGGSGGGSPTVELTQAEYDALVTAGTVDSNTFYIITDAEYFDQSNYYTSAQTESAITQAVSGKQDTLISGTNIKTINNESILGSGNITIQGGGGGIDSGTVQTMIDESISGKTDTSAFTAHTGDSTIHVTSSEKSTWNAKSDFSGDYNDLSNKLSAGTNITIVDNVISAEGGSDINVVQTTGTSTADVMSQSAVSTQLNNKANKTAAVGGYRFGSSSGNVYLQFRNVNNSNIGNSLYYPKINGKEILTTNNIYAQNNYNFQLVETSAITTAITSSSTDAQVPSAKAVYDQFGGLKLVKLSQSEYDSLATKDNSTLYVIVN